MFDKQLNLGVSVKKISTMAVSVVLFSAALFGGSPATASESISTSDGVFQEAKFGTQESKTIKQDANTASAAALCQFNQAGDYPHISGDGSGQLSAHGWWINVNCKATLAVVKVQLQYKNQFGIWINRGTAGTLTVKSGGGSGNRATARYDCVGGAVTLYRSSIDVDAVGVTDLPNKTYSPEVKVACG